MKIRMLGTGYGECKIKSLSAKDYRGKGGVLADDRILFDIPEDIFSTAKELGFHDIFRTVDTVIISHSHSGHFSPRALAHLAKKKKIRVFASEEVAALIPESENIMLTLLKEFGEYSFGKYTLAALPANHRTDIPGEPCFNFVLMGDRSLFYGLDGGFINGESFDVLRNIRLDAVICDTALELSPRSERSLWHNSIEAAAEMKKIFTDRGILHEKSRFILSHIPSDKRRQIHEELTPIAREAGMVLAYDGYFVTI